MTLESEYKRYKQAIYRANSQLRKHGMAAACTKPDTFEAWLQKWVDVNIPL